MRGGGLCGRSQASGGGACGGGVRTGVATWKGSAWYLFLLFFFLSIGPHVHPPPVTVTSPHHRLLSSPGYARRVPPRPFLNVLSFRSLSIPGQNAAPLLFRGWTLTMTAVAHSLSVVHWDEGPHSGATARARHARQRRGPAAS